MFAPLLLLVLWMGVYPSSFLDPDPRLGRQSRRAGARRRARDARRHQPRRSARVVTQRMPINRRSPISCPALPEIALACAAMALLLIGVFRGEGSTRLVSWLSVLVLIGDPGAGRAPSGSSGASASTACSSPTLSPLFMKALVLVGSAVAILMAMRYNEEQRIAPLRVPGADPAGDDRHDGDDLGQRPDHALSRPRIAEPGALCRRRLRPRFGRARARPGSNISSSARCRRECCSTARR